MMTMDRRAIVACSVAGGVLLWWWRRRGSPRFSRADRGLDNVVNYSARMIAASRAVESERPDAIFVDPLARVFAGDEALSRSRKRLAGAGGMNRIAVRTKYFDDALLAALSPQRAVPIAQVVLLGAGMDSRAWRLPLPPGVKWFEADAGEVLDIKERLIMSAQGGSGAQAGVWGWWDAVRGWGGGGRGAGGGGVQAEMRAATYSAVATDLAHPAWTKRLREAGFSPQEPAVWLAEGLTMYLDESQNSALFGAVSAASARGSVLLVSLVNEASLRRAQKSENELMGTWKWGTDDPRGFFGARGWSVVRLNQPGDPDASYGRYGQPKTPIDDHSEGKVMYLQASNVGGAI